jgi:hypothetical protein
MSAIPLYGTEYTGKYQIKDIVVETLKGAQTYCRQHSKNIQEWELDYADAYEMEDIIESLETH